MARLLLLVYVPLLQIALLHVHRPLVYVADECCQCQNNEPHAGHISSQAASLHDCALCQFTSLEYVQPAAITLPIPVVAVQGHVLPQAYLIAAVAVAHPSTRAPPYSF